MQYQTIVTRGETASLRVGEVNPIIGSGNAGLLDGRPRLKIGRSLHFIPVPRFHGEVQLHWAAGRSAVVHSQNSGGNVTGFTGKRAFFPARAIKRGGGKIIGDAGAQIGNGDARRLADDDLVRVAAADRAIMNRITRRVRVGTRIPAQGDIRGGGAMQTGEPGN